MQSHFIAIVSFFFVTVVFSQSDSGKNDSVKLKLSDTTLVFKDSTSYKKGFAASLDSTTNRAMRKVNSYIDKNKKLKNDTIVKN